MTWDTADPYSGSPTVPETPQRPSATIYKSQSLATPIAKRRTYSQDLEAELASHVHHLSPNPGLVLPPVEPSRQLSSSPNPSLSKRACLNGESIERQGSFGTARNDAAKMRSAGSMQTPPPTSTSASKRKAKQAQVAKLVQDSASRVNKLSSPTFAQAVNPEQNNDFIQASPQFFPSLEFSPDVFAFPSTGPATAPVYPQQRLFWDPDASLGPMDMDLSGGGLDLFEPTSPFDFNQFVTEAALQPVPATSTYCMGTDGQSLRAQSTVSHSFTTETSIPEMSACASSTARVSTAKFAVKPLNLDYVVDPNLLLGNPGLQDLSENLGNSMSKHAREIRQPYLHQMQESRREREVQRSRKAKWKPSSHIASSQEVKPNPEKRPRLEHRSTDTVLAKGGNNNRKNSQESSYQPLKLDQERDNGHRRRKLSPVKSQPPDISSTTLEHPRLRTQTSVTFTIDGNGRARTETRLAREESESEPDQAAKRIDHSAWGNSDSETSEDADADIATSFCSSFTFPSSKQPKLARFSTDSISHSKRSSYSSTYASSRSEHTVPDIGPAAQIRRRSSHARKGHNLSGIQNSHGGGSLLSGVISDFGPATTGDLASEAETVVDSDQANGDAQHALKEVMKDRARGKRTEKSSSSSSKPREKARRQAFPPTKHRTQSASRHEPAITTPTKIQPHNVYDPAYNISPTTITDPDLTSPSTDRGSSASDSTRCVCLTSESGGHLMIQW